MKTRSLCAALAASLSLLLLPGASAQEAPLAAGTRAPAFATRTVDGKPLSLKSLRGHVVLLDYWATWCGPCRIATPTLEALHRKFNKRGLRVVGMSVDDANTVAQVRPAMKQLGITYAVSAVPSVNGKIGAAYRVNGIPSQYLIDKKGIVRWSQAGFAPGEGKTLGALIQKLLAEKG